MLHYTVLCDHTIVWVQQQEAIWELMHLIVSSVIKFTFTLHCSCFKMIQNQSTHISYSKMNKDEWITKGKRLGGSFEQRRPSVQIFILKNSCIIVFLYSIHTE